WTRSPDRDPDAPTPPSPPESTDRPPGNGQSSPPGIFSRVGDDLGGSGQRPTICLNMIVRDEAHIVSEALRSVMPYLDTWVIVDTGSTDGTQDLIREIFAAERLRGELYERPWRDFGTNRTEALQLCSGRADY